MSEPEPQNETWLYAGQREVAGHQLAHAWWPGTWADSYEVGQDVEEQLLLYKKLPGAAIGAPYTVKVLRDGDRVRVQGLPVFEPEGTRATDTQRAVWQSWHAVALRNRQRYLAERRVASDNQVELALTKMLRLVHQARTRADKRALVTAAYERLNAAVWEER